MQNDFGVGIVGVLIGALITGLFSWLSARAKSRSDQGVAATAAQAAVEVAVMAEWQKLNSALSKRVSDLEAELAKVRRDHSDELEEMRRKHRAEIRAMRELNEGLQRQIAQNSQSTASLIGDLKKEDGCGE